MTAGVGGSNREQALSGLTSRRDKAVPIELAEFHQRIDKLRALLEAAGLDALYLDATTSLRYFTGMACYPSERLHGVLISTRGELVYICPAFEEQKTRAQMLVEGDFATWQEHEDPTALVGLPIAVVGRRSRSSGTCRPTCAVKVLLLGPGHMR